jgi:hypothetical protein
MYMGSRNLFRCNRHHSGRRIKLNNPGTDNTAGLQNAGGSSSVKGYLRTSVVIFICIAVNVLGRSITYNHPMPA